MDRRPADDLDVEHEELETIPWAMLAEHMDSQRWRGYTKYVLAVFVFFAVVVVGLEFRSGPAATVVDLPSASIDPVAPVEAPNPTPGSTDPTTTVVVQREPGLPPGPALYSEADLMAVLPATYAEADGALRRAVMAAEWFVTDYFTTDTSEPPASWVEWVAVADVVADGAGPYVVTVAFQTLLTAADGSVMRSDPMAVAVEVADDESLMTVTNVPRLVPFDALAAAEVPTGERGRVPDDVAALALADAGVHGEPVEVLGGSRGADGTWTVIVAVTDRIGLSWELALDVTP